MLWGMAQDSAVSIAIGYRLDGPGIESQWGRNYLHPSRPALGTTQSPEQWVPGVFPWSKAAGFVAVSTNPHITPRLKKELSYTCAPPLGLCDMFWCQIHANSAVYGVLV